PYTGAVLEDASTSTRGFMSEMRSWHRWLGGDSSSVGATLIDYSNLLFVFIIASGLYLWLPAVWRWRTVRGVVLFQRRYINAKVRDFNWHHVFGFWMLVPLFLIAVSGAVISFPWASNLVYAAVGEQPPQRGGGGGGPGAPVAAPGGSGAGAQTQTDAAIEAPRASLQQLFDGAVSLVPDWQRVTLPLSLRGDHVDVQVELRSNERRPPRRTLELSTLDASVMSDSGAGSAEQ